MSRDKNHTKMDNTNIQFIGSSSRFGRQTAEIMPPSQLMDCMKSVRFVRKEVNSKSLFLLLLSFLAWRHATLSPGGELLDASAHNHASLVICIYVASRLYLTCCQPVLSLSCCHFHAFVRLPRKWRMFQRENGGFSVVFFFVRSRKANIVKQCFGVLRRRTFCAFDVQGVIHWYFNAKRSFYSWDDVYTV